MKRKSCSSSHPYLLMPCVDPSIPCLQHPASNVDNRAQGQPERLFFSYLSRPTRTSGMFLLVNSFYILTICKSEFKQSWSGPNMVVRGIDPRQLGCVSFIMFLLQGSGNMLVSFTRGRMQIFPSREKDG